MSTPPPPASPKPRPRIVEWFWRGDGLRAARAQEDDQRAAFFCEQRARIAAEVGQRTLEPSAPWLAGEAEHLAAALFVESIGWSLRLAANQASTLSQHQPAARAELVELAHAERSRLLSAAGDADTLSRVLEHLLERRFETHASTRQDSEQAARELESVANALLRTLAVKRAEVEGVLLQRAARMGLLAIAAAALVLGALRVNDALERRAELSFGKAWTTSSQYDTGCISPQQVCGSDKSYFFHTQEERNAWVELDLAKAQRVSKVRVFNRQDCCAERATPLVVEVSLDRDRWQEVARRKDAFDEWTARFSPVEARYVRLRVARRSMLHLKEVRIF